MEDAVTAKVRDITRDVANADPFEPAVERLAAYIGDEVIPHAIAEEQSIYQVAAQRPHLAKLVDEMTVEHRQIDALVGRLVRAGSGEEAVERAVELGRLFAAHVGKENDLLLPPLVEDQEVDMSELLGQMHRLTESARRHAGAAETGGASETPSSEAAGIASIAEPELDVRTIVPARRHQEIFATYASLVPGTAFVLVNDHDPKPLRYQFEAEHTGEFSWEYLDTGPRVWRVRIGREQPA